jgi:hypothetical protein
LKSILSLRNQKLITNMSKMLGKARNHYDNALFDLEKKWDKLSPRDILRRKKLIQAALAMVKIDKDIRGWEAKLKSVS